MPTAFGRAMLATINGKPQTFRMELCSTGTSITMNCGDFLQTRPDEDNLLDSIPLASNGTVLDWGCGVGRHLAHLRTTHPSVHCVGVDICDLMLDHCSETIARPATFVQSYEEVCHHRYDLILLLGNGLGVLGRKSNAVERLRQLIDSLKPEGRIIVESGNPFGQGYCAPEFTIEYAGYRDGPFPWGYADGDWVSQTFRNLGLGVEIRKSLAPGGIFFFAIGQPV